MNRLLRKCFALAWLLSSLGIGTPQTAQAQAVIFPQETQPGQANLTEVTGTYTLSNDLFSASFVKADGKLTFGGCTAMNLQAEENLFKIKLQNNDEVGSSAMTLGTVTVENLTGNAFAVRGAERFNGKQLVANYTYDNLQIVWRAVLRDGSHYLRTELEITANGADVLMDNITPMLYTVNNVTGNTPPVVVGNTRGAVIASNKIFAGLETPMGVQTSGAASDLDHFTKDGWTASDFSWRPSEIPSGMTGVTLENLAVKRGYLHFNTTGSQTITLTFASGTHKLNIKGVDLCDPLTGEVVASDYHAGSTGDSHSNNVYTLNVPAATNYMVRFFVDDVTETITSTGNITYSGGVADVEIVRDLQQGEQTTQQKAIQMKAVALKPARTAPVIKLITNVSGTADKTLTVGGSAQEFTWTTGASSWPTNTSDVPAEVTALQTSAATNRKMEKIVTFETAGKLTTTVTYTSGNHKLNLFGIDIVDGNGNVIAADYHHGTMGGSLTNNIYTFIVPAGTFKIRYHAADYSGDQVTLNAGKASMALTAIGSITTTASNETWTNSTWSAATNVPSGITSLQGKDGSDIYNITAANTKSFTNPYAISSAGTLNVEVLYVGGSSRIDAVGVELLNARGQVLSSDYHFGYSGNAKENNTYQVIVPEAGAYYLRYYCSLDKQSSLPTSGKMNFALTPVEGELTEASAPLTTSWQTSTWTAATNVPAGITNLQIVDASTVNVTAANTKSFTRMYIINAGGMAVEMKYLSGSKRLDAVGVELLDMRGNVVAHDYHFGYCGNAKDNNLYHLVVPEDGMYQVRYYCSTDYQGALPATGEMKLYLSESIGSLNATTTTWNGNWQSSSWWKANTYEIQNRLIEAGAQANQLYMASRSLHLDLPEGVGSAQMKVNFTWVSGQKRLNIYGVELADQNGSIVASDYHAGTTGTSNSNNNYTFTISGQPSGNYELRYYVSNKETLNSSGTMSVDLGFTYTLHLYAETATPIKGVWRRNTTLAQGKTWKVSHVVGLIAQSGETTDMKYTDQSRRSFLAYSERERAVPWRPFPCYISWYELNINRNNAQDYSTNMTVSQCENVVKQWKTNLFDKYGKKVKSFLWDDGWDEYGTWRFNPNFPNGFTEPNAVAEKMGSSLGAWLGPVGGYGTSGNYRRNYWSGRGGMQLSNPAYYKTFIDACKYMLTNYSFNFFKFDGISAQFSAVGPDAGDTGIENAEGIIGIERDIRAIKPDVFLNTSVGTWASPFWFQFTDAVWRQENDYDKVGNQGSDRERWITYRDNLVHQNYVTNSPLCPINTLMTHGFIFSKFGGAQDRDYAGVVRELRCAFACGSGMVELYNDYDLTNTVCDDTHPAGSLWKEIADCIDWQERNADVLPDIHWVGGDPWTGTKSEVYGWASWNGKKATLALRNGQASVQSFTTTLRKALEIPAHVTGFITFTKAFDDQADLEGLAVGEPIDIDTELTINFPASSVYVFDGVDSDASTVDAAAMNALLLEAKRTLEHTGTGYPKAAADDVTTGSTARTTLAAAITTAQQQAYAPSQEALNALQQAINTYKAATEEIQLLQDGYAYALTTQIGNAEYYLDYNAENGSLALAERPEGTAIPATATFVCHNVEGQTLLVNNAGKYLTVPTGSDALTDGYAKADNLLSLQKTAADFGVLRLANNAGNSWLTASASAVGNAATAAEGTTLLFHPMEYANLVTLRAPSASDGNTYASLCLPFNALVPEGVTAYWGKAVDNREETMTLQQLNGGIPANTAVVLVGKEDASTEARFIPAADEKLGTLDGTNLLKGVCDSNEARNTSATTYVLNGNRTTGAIGFYLYTADYLPAYKAYLELTESQAMGFRFDFGGEVTNLNGVQSDAEGNHLPLYDLSGRRTLRPQTGGVYISGKKKIIVK
ncbi:hypothetical protein MR642_03565 [bacterium]|nr:hypothetical protein [bacterium]